MTRVRSFVGMIAVIGSLGLASPSHAAQITYTVAAIATGTLGGSPFMDALVTVTLVGDTSTVFQPIPDGLPDLRANRGTATVTIAGVGSATFNHPNGYAVVAFPMIPGEIPLPSVGIWEGFGEHAETGTAILGVGNDSLTGYNLTSPLGPLPGSAGGGASEPDGSPHGYATTAGAFTIQRTGEVGTLTVSIATPVPEPTSLSLLGVGGLSLLAARRRRREQRS